MDVSWTLKDAASSGNDGGMPVNFLFSRGGAVLWFLAVIKY